MTSDEQRCKLVRLRKAAGFDSLTGRRASMLIEQQKKRRTDRVRGARDLADQGR